MNQESILNRVTVECRPHFNLLSYSKSSRIRTSLDCNKLLTEGEERKEGETELCGSDSGY
ncbi:hypothetical protein DPMN_068260 [Dreissena polymorpha]|uniref:Uncharacterized protein n=1 Tax=Dreissena polymorpha TaxID=45954 RepID=A0A9D3Z196_DREPO|nr:hypothetical protein DPMN_068260 [Dreissena polymorpha]